MILTLATRSRKEDPTAPATVAATIVAGAGHTQRTSGLSTTTRTERVPELNNNKGWNWNSIYSKSARKTYANHKYKQENRPHKNKKNIVIDLQKKALRKINHNN